VDRLTRQQRTDLFNVLHALEHAELVEDAVTAMLEGDASYTVKARLDQLAADIRQATDGLFQFIRHHE
jgi:hypothetical protein